MFVFGALGPSSPRKELKAMFKSIAEKRDYVTKLLKNADPEVVERCVAAILWTRWE